MQQRGWLVFNHLTTHHHKSIYVHITQLGIPIAATPPLRELRNHRNRRTPSKPFQTTARLAGSRPTPPLPTLPLAASAPPARWAATSRQAPVARGLRAAAPGRGRLESWENWAIWASHALVGMLEMSVRALEKYGELDFSFILIHWIV